MYNNLKIKTMDVYLNQLKLKTTPAGSDYLIGVEPGGGSSGGGGFRTQAGQFAKASDLSGFATMTQVNSAINGITGNNTDWIYLYNETDRTVVYRKVNNVVYVMFNIVNYVLAAGSLFTMPVNYRSVITLYIGAVFINTSTSNNISSALRFIVAQNGNVSYAAGLGTNYNASNILSGYFSYPV